MATIEDLESLYLKAVKDPTEAKFNPFLAESWIKNTNGANQNGKGYTKVTISWVIYFDCSFSMAEYTMIPSLIWSHHNIMIDNMEVLLEGRIKFKSTNNL